MLRSYKYRLFPTPEQGQALSDILRAGCWLYNAALHHRRKRWQESRHSVTYSEQAAMWRDWRNEEAADNPLRMLNMSAGRPAGAPPSGCRFSSVLSGPEGLPSIQESERF